MLLSTHVLSEVEQTCDRLLVIRRGRIAAQGTLDELRAQARSRRQVNVEMKGKEVEAGLREIPSVDEVEDVGAVDGRRRYSLLVSGEGDVRPQVFDMAKRRNWVLWDLHEEGASLADLFHSLTALGEDEDYTAESAEPSEGGRFGWRWPPFRA